MTGGLLSDITLETINTINEITQNAITGKLLIKKDQRFMKQKTSIVAVLTT